MSLTNVSLLTGNLQPKGHPFWVDEKTLDSAAALLADRPLAANVSHDGASSSFRAPAGFFRGIYREGLHLRAKSIEFLDSFKANFKAMHDTITELGEKFPEQFGVSLSMKYAPVWVLRDGREIPAKVVDGRLAELAPPEAVRPLPSARVTSVYSGDFVNQPAANLHGLLSCLLAEIDSPSPTNMSATPVSYDQAALDAKLAEQKQALTAELSTKLTEAETQLAAAIKAKSEIEASLNSANNLVTELKTELAGVQTGVIAQLAAVGVKVDKLEPEPLKAALKSRIEGEAQCLLAARGIKPLPESLKPAEEAVAANLSTDAGILAAYLEHKPGSPESIAFSEKHRDALWRAQSARK